MKLRENVSTVERVGTGKETDFKIKTTAKAFHILSSGIYTDIIGAIVRELSCNAHDSHVAANKENVPIEIHAPNSLEPYLSIKDFGVGLSDPEIREIYSTYFESTKTHSNKFTGAMGLGSKTPFAYSSAFEIISRYDGTRTTYSAFINEKGVPSVNDLQQRPTTESNGVEVKVAIKEHDFSKTEQAILQQLEFFDPKPKIFGIPNHEFSYDYSELIQGDDWQLKRRAGIVYNNYNTLIRVVQGNVIYKVSLSQLDKKLREEAPDNTLDQFYNYIGNHFLHLDLFFKIGEIDFAVSREEIQYTEENLEKIIKRLETTKLQIQKLFKTEMRNLIKGVRPYPAYQKLNEYCQKKINKNHGWSDFVNIMVFDSKAKKTIQSAQDNETEETILENYAKGSTSLFCFHEDFEHCTLKHYTTDSSIISLVPASRRIHSDNDKIEINPDNTNFLIFIDTNKINLLSIKKFCDSEIEKWFEKAKKDSRYYSKTYNVIIVRPTSLKTDEDLKKAKMDLKEIKSSFGGIDHINASSIPVQRTERYKSKNQVYVYRGTRLGSKQRIYHCWEQTNTSVDSYASKDNLYLFLKGGSTPYFGNDTSQHAWEPRDFLTNIYQMITLINMANGTNYTKDDLFGISKTLVDKVQDEKNWKNIFSLAVDSAKKLKSELIFSRKYRNTDNCLGIQDCVDSQQFKELIDELSDQSKFKRLVSPYVDGFRRYEKYISSYIMLSKFLEKNHPAIAQAIFGDEFESKFFSLNDFRDYRMLKFIKGFGSLGYDGFQSQMKEVFEYIKLIDQQQRNSK